MSSSAREPATRWALAGVVTRGRPGPVTAPAWSAAGGEATPPVTGRWDHGGLGNRSLRDDSQERLIADEPRPTIPHAPSESTFGVVVKASTKPWPRQLGSSILRALPPRSQV